MNKSGRTILSIVAALVAIALGFFAASKIVAAKEPPPKRDRSKKVREAIVEAVSETDVAIDVALQGRLVAVENIPLFAEVTGVFEASANPFKVGVYYKKGDLLARINNTEQRYQLLAQKSQFANSLAQAMPELKIDYSATFSAWDAYLRAFDPEQSIKVLPEVKDDAARFFLNGKNIYNQYYSIKAAEERLAKYALRAPVSGTLTQVNATVGALVRNGQSLGTLTASSYELSATVPVADLNFLKPGTRASLQGPNGETYPGRVSRISTQIDPNTQTATVYLSVQGKGLREGLYLTGAAAGEALQNVVELPQNLLVGSNEVYVLNDSTLQRQKVSIVRRNDDQLFVRGLVEGTQVLAEAIPGAYTGMKVNPKVKVDARQGASPSVSTL